MMTEVLSNPRESLSGDEASGGLSPNDSGTE